MTWKLWEIGVLIIVAIGVLCAEPIINLIAGN